MHIQLQCLLHMLLLNMCHKTYPPNWAYMPYMPNICCTYMAMCLHHIQSMCIKKSVLHKVLQT